MSCCYQLFYSGCSRSESDPNLSELSVDFNWLKKQKCFDERSPAITANNTPEGTRSFNITMYDITNRYDHGGGTVKNDGSGMIAIGSLKNYHGPCPCWGSPKYEFTVKAMDANGEIVGMGKKIKRYPPETE